MSEAHLILGTEGFGRSAAGLVYGPLCLRVNDNDFPHPEWSDFVVVVLGWWCDAARRLLNGDAGRMAVRFMEGPYLVELEAIDRRVWLLTSVDDTHAPLTRSSAEVSAAPLVESILRASTRAITLCRQQGWWSTDADHLLSAAAGLRTLAGLKSE